VQYHTTTVLLPWLLCLCVSGACVNNYYCILFKKILNFTFPRVPRNKAASTIFAVFFPPFVFNRHSSVVLKPPLTVNPRIRHHLSTYYLYLHHHACSTGSVKYCHTKIKIFSTQFSSSTHPLRPFILRGRIGQQKKVEYHLSRGRVLSFYS